MKKPQYKSEKNQKIKGSIKEPIFQALEFLPVRFYLLFSTDQFRFQLYFQNPEFMSASEYFSSYIGEVPAVHMASSFWSMPTRPLPFS